MRAWRVGRRRFGTEVDIKYSRTVFATDILEIEKNAIRFTGSRRKYIRTGKAGFKACPWLGSEFDLRGDRTPPKFHELVTRAHEFHLWPRRHVFLFFALGGGQAGHRGERLEPHQAADRTTQRIRNVVIVVAHRRRIQDI